MFLILFSTLFEEISKKITNCTNFENCWITLSVAARKEYSQEDGGRGVESPATNCITDVECGAEVPK